MAGRRPIRLWFVPHPRARRYVLRLRPDGSARVTIPRRGSVAQARRFVQTQTAWLEKQLQRLASQPTKPHHWQDGTEILLRGETARLEVASDAGQPSAWLGAERVPIADPSANLRPAVEAHLRRLATRELPARVFELAAVHQLPVRRVSVRNQRSRWGSCSRSGTVSLNWRLVQVPTFVRDYIVLHELAHLKEMNHSRRFWREVQRLCPEFALAERWLKQHRELLA